MVMKGNRFAIVVFSPPLERGPSARLENQVHALVKRGNN